MNKDQKVKLAAENLLTSVYGYFGMNKQTKIDWLDLVGAMQRMNHTLDDYASDRMCPCSGCQRFFKKS